MARKKAFSDDKGKDCTKCKKYQLFEEYYANSRTYDGLMTWCKECSRQYTRDAYKKDPEKRLKLQRAWYQRNKEYHYELTLRWKREHPEEHRRMTRESVARKRARDKENKQKGDE